MSLIAVVPARAGSKGVPGKNLIEVGGKPLIGHILTAARAAKGIDRLIVSTEDDRIAETAQRFGAEILFKRPAALAEDHINIIQVLCHAVEELDRLGVACDAILSLQPIAPLLSTASIEAAIAMWHKTGCDSVFAIREVDHNHPFRIQSVDEEGRVTPYVADGERYLQRQDLPVFHSNSGGLYLRRRELLEKWTGKDFCLGSDRRAVVVPQWEAINIDTPVDLEMFRAYVTLKSQNAAND